MKVARAWIVFSAIVPVTQNVVKVFLASIAVQLLGVKSKLTGWAMDFAIAHSTVRTRQVSTTKTTFAAWTLAHVHNFAEQEPLVLQHHFRSYFFAPIQVVGSSGTKSTT